MHSPAVDNYLFDISVDIRMTFEALRDIIFDTVKDVEECMKWNYPFYSKNGFLCYLSYNKKEKKVAVGFIEGCMMEDKYGVLNQDTRNIKKLFINNIDDIDIKMIRYFLKQGVKINQTKAKNFVIIPKRKNK